MKRAWKDIQGSPGFEDKGYIWPHKLVGDQKIRVFLQLKDVQVYQGLLFIHVPRTPPNSWTVLFII